MKEPCMCGDPYCFFCGPLQGNYKCEICGAWTLDGGCKNSLECEERSNNRYDFEKDSILNKTSRE